MANEIEFIHTATGATLKLFLGNTLGQRWNTAGTPAWETLTLANIGSYDIDMAESPAGSYRYLASVPAGINTRLDLIPYIYVGAPAVAADLPNFINEPIVIPWSGSAVLQEANQSLASELPAAAPTAAAIRADLDASSTKLANLDATVSSRATPAQVATAVNARPNVQVKATVE